MFYPAFLLLYLEPISHAPDGLNILRLCGIELDFLTNLFDMHSYCGNVSDGIHIPDFPEQFFLRVYMVWILGQKS